MAEGTILVADIGGTQARLALARAGVVLPGSQTRVPVADHASPDALIAAYVAAQKVRPAGAVLALAGPVAGGQGRLTNGDWVFDAGTLGRVAGGPVRLIEHLDTREGREGGAGEAERLFRVSVDVMLHWREP